MKQKITWGKALGLALKEKGYRWTLLIAILIFGFGIFMYTKGGWDYPFKPWGLFTFAIPIGMFLARPSNITADPTASGYPEYTS